jgi:cytochrome c oxidase subunit 3
LPRPWVLWLNTFFLFLSSGTLEWARRLAHRDEFKEARFWWLIAGAFTLFFVVGQLIAWQEMSRAGHVLGSGPSSSFFYLLTALHGIHVLAGLIAWSWVTLQTTLSRGTKLQARSRIGLCTIYWHFLFIVWLAVLGLFWLTQ